MTTQEIRITAQITLEVPVELSKEELMYQFNGSVVRIYDADQNRWHSKIEVTKIEEEAEIYGNE